MQDAHRARNRPFLAADGDAVAVEANDDGDQILEGGEILIVPAEDT